MGAKVPVLADSTTHVDPLSEVLIVPFVLRIPPFDSIKVDLLRDRPLLRLELLVDLFVIEMVFR